MELEPICIYCKHFIEGQKCEAFEVIPSLIWSRGLDHDTPLEEQDNDIVFEPIDEE